MTKLIQTLGLLLVSALTLGGCELYFGGDHNDGDHWTYCGSDGQYDCNGNDCAWVSSECEGTPGAECTSSQDCAAGCYCQDGTCEEAGFCDGETPCPDGFHCNTDRSSCEPNACSDTVACPSGQVCTNGTCTDDPATCEGDIAMTCNLVAPKCPVGQVATMVDGCYDGGCRAITACEGPAVCGHLQHQEDCGARSGDCKQVFTGINCTNPDGTACNTPGAGGCTCESFEYARCDKL